MKRIVVNGAANLCGEIAVSGSKNASLPIIFACILTNGVSRIENLPDIGDVRVALEILSSFGAEITFKNGRADIDTRNIRFSNPKPLHAEKIRASTYLIGSCLSRFGRCPIIPFGGCNFSLRPIDMHISAAIAFGASFDGNLLTANSLHGNEINFDKASVGATVNAILLASSAKGESVIRGCAVEPHIDLLIDFLNSCGADIKRFDRELRISGRELHGGNIRINSDMIEAGSYLALSAMLGNGIKVACCPTDEMTSVFAALNDLGANIECDSNGRLSASIEKYKPISLVAAPYPDFPTDLQPIFAPLMALFGGGSITDTVWEGRFGYLNSLSDFGVQSFVDKNKAHIHRSRLHNGITWATDLRGGMAALMCALCAEGRSEILSAEIILRGYENLVEKLCSVGADIRIDYYN